MELRRRFLINFIRQASVLIRFADHAKVFPEALQLQLITFLANFSYTFFKAKIFSKLF